MRVNDPATAVVWFQRALNGSPDPAVLTRLGEAQLLSGDPATARITLEKVLEKDTHNRRARALLRQTAAQGQM